MDVFEYNMLPLAFRKAFEKENGDMPDSEFIARIWFDIACKWHAGWQLAIDHANELRAPMPQLPPPERTRTFMVTLEPGMLPVIHETKLPANAPQPSGLRDDYVESLKETPRPNYEQEPCPWPVPPNMPKPSTQAPKAPVTAAEAAAESVQDSEENAPKAFVLPVSAELHDRSSFLIEVGKETFNKINVYETPEAARLDAIRKGFALVGFAYWIDDEQIAYWRRHPQTKALSRSFHPTKRG